MVLNYIWVAFFVIAFIVALCKLIFMGDVEIFTELVNSTFSSSKTAFEISLGLTGILALWLGVMKIGENSGMEFFGHSAIADPLGELIATAEEEETILYATLERSMLLTERAQMPVFRDRRPDLYGELVKPL